MFHPILLLLGFWYFLPTYVANGFAVFGKFIRPRHTIDGGRILEDGQPVFGPGKTWEGFIVGFVAGVLIGLLQIVTAPILLSIIVQYVYLPPELVPIVLITLPLVILVALGALVGDLVGSFIKRRFMIARGRPAPLLDQLDFLIGAMLLGALITPIHWVLAIFMVILTPIIHLAANIIGYLIGLKQEPW
ncbi:MAG: CDP-2,3-bis-(O-geranylgeranyl)-sn-glycerol synthase [Promethearchaeota archaeon]